MSVRKKSGEWRIDEHTPAESLHHVAELVDGASDANSPSLAGKALGFCDELESCLSIRQLVELNYFRANAWSVIRQTKHSDQRNPWEWDQPEALREIFYLRSAVRSSEFHSLEPFRQCQILVNTGNILSFIGRPIEAIEYWSRALALLPNFAMARGNLGFGLEGYALCLYDIGHQVVILKEACRLLRSVTEGGVLWESTGYKKFAERMVNKAIYIEERVDFSKAQRISFFDHSLGRSVSERNYRAWALSKGLFLSPLNDLGSFPVAAHDVLHLPDMILPSSEPYRLIGFFNQLKQEYVSARFLCWQGITKSDSHTKHYSDKMVLLFDTLDYPAYSVYVEQVKLAFRVAYSLFDKIAFFMNDYWSLGVRENLVNFQSIWFEGDTRKKAKELRSCFKIRKNPALRGLYWLSKDFVEEGKEDELVLGRTMEPDAYKLRSIRNHLEHKYVKAHDNLWGYADYPDRDLFADKLAFHLSTKDLNEKTIRILKLARAGLIYLSLAVHQEERSKTNEENVLLIPEILPQWRM